MLFFIAATATANAQTVVDDTASAASANDLKQVLEIVGDALNDPVSAQVRRLRKVPTGFCGELNAKNTFGGYVGFKPFIVDMQKREITIPTATHRSTNLGQAMEIEIACRRHLP